MRRIEYSPRRLAMMMGGGTLMTLLAAWTWWRTGGVLVGLGMPLFATSAALAGRAILSGRAAITFDDRALSINSLWRSATLPWRTVQDIRVESHTIRLYWVIPVHRSFTLVVISDGGAFGGRKHRIPGRLLAAPAGGVYAVAAMLQAARVAALGEAAVAMKDAPHAGWGAAPVQARRPRLPDPEPTSDFDPDEAIARYLAAKQVSTAAQTPGAEPAAPAAWPAAQPPARPVFGRRTA